MRRFALLALAALFVAPGTPAGAQTPGPAIAVDGPWAPTSIGQARVGAAYMTIVNHGMAADRLLGAASPAAGKVELHQSSVVNGVATMRPVQALDLKPHEPVELRPGGLHLMLTDLKAPLTAGEKLQLTLNFEKAGQIPISIVVGAAPEADHGHH